MIRFTDSAFAICCIAIGLSFAEGLIPSEQFRKQIRLLMTLLLTASFFRGISLVDFSAFRQPYAADESAETDEIVRNAHGMQEEALREAVRNGLNAALSERQVPCRVQQIDLHIAEEGGISIDRAVITGNLLTGSVYLREWLGTGPEITEGAYDAEESAP